MPHMGRIVLGLIIGFLTITCARITVNVYFPAAELEDAASKIEQEVRSDDADPAVAPNAPTSTPTQKPQGSSHWRLWRYANLRVGPAHAEAQGTINVNITTPAIRSLINSRKKRYASLRPLLGRCVLGENNRGLVDLRSLQGLSLKDKAQAKALRDQENRDRQRLYQELTAANKLPQEKVGEVAAIFANVNRRKAQPGWCIQDTSGNWSKK